MRRTLRFSPEAMLVLRQIERKYVKSFWAIMDKLADNPDSVTLQTMIEEPSIYWIAIPGDYTVWFEILDEVHAIRVIDIA